MNIWLDDQRSAPDDWVHFLHSDDPEGIKIMKAFAEDFEKAINIIETEPPEEY